MSILKNDWAPLLEEEFQKDYYIQLREFLVDEYNHHTIYPDKYDIFNALHYTDYKNVKVVIWAEQGVLLLNTVLTVRKGEANSHKGKGWEQLTDRIIELVAQKEEPVVFLLWGKHAQAKKELIHHSPHLILESPHPSPFSANRGFFGNDHFQRANEFLLQQGRQSIDWQIDDV